MREFLPGEYRRFFTVVKGGKMAGKIPAMLKFVFPVNLFTQVHAPVFIQLPEIRVT